MKKSLITLSISTCILLVGLSTTNVKASTSPINTEKFLTQPGENKKMTQEKSAGVIVDINSQLAKINKYYFDDNMSWEVFDSYRAIRIDDQYTDIKNFNLEANNINNITVKDVAPEYIGGNDFINDTDIEQSFATDSYSHATTKTTSTSVTKGFSIGGKNTTLKVPIVLPENNIEINATLNAGITETTTDSDTVTFTVPPQPVKVPAHKKYRAEIVYNRQSLSGNIDFRGIGTNLKSNITVLMSWTGGLNRPSYDRTFTFDTENLWKTLSTSQKNSIEGLTFNNNSFNIEGTATINGIAGTKLVVHLYDITNNQAPVLVRTIPIN